MPKYGVNIVLALPEQSECLPRGRHEKGIWLNVLLTLLGYVPRS